MSLSINKIKEIRSLKEKKYRDELNQFLIEGKKILFEALNSDYIIKEVILTFSNERLISEIEKIKKVNILQCSESDFNKISLDRTPSGIAAVLEKKSFDINEILKDHHPLIILDRINDPGNLGTIIRTAAWFGFNNILLSKESCEITNPKVIKATMGSIFSIKFIENIDLLHTITHLKNNNIKILATDTNGTAINKFILTKDYAIILGNESNGISQDIINICDEIIAIPGKSKIESLNVAISAGIIFYALSNG